MLMSRTQNGYVIPAGTSIVGNHHAIHRDASYYGDDVEKFRLERWFDQAGKLKPSMRNFQFGFGRRVCPGQHVANNSVYINAATLMWAFNIGKKKDVNGKEIDIDVWSFTNTVNSHPNPFQASFTPRIEGLKTALYA